MTTRTAKYPITLHEDSHSPSDRVLPLLVESGTNFVGPQPVTVGVPVPRGWFAQPDEFFLSDGVGTQVRCQGEALSRWSDGSVRWLLVDWLARGESSGQPVWALHRGKRGPDLDAEVKLTRVAGPVEVDTGVARFRLDETSLSLRAWLEGACEVFDESGACWALTDVRGRVGTANVEAIEVEASGPIRATVKITGRFTGKVPARFVARYSFFAGTALARIDLTLHNSQRARHPGGMWDLGDAGSMLFADLSLQMTLGGSAPCRTDYSTESDGPARHIDGDLEIYQGSSGGENWQSANHVDRSGTVPVEFRGYRVRAGGTELRGHRASPVLRLSDGERSLTVALPGFWQQFPKALETTGRTLAIRLFPRQFRSPFELQGGEQKTHTIWLDLAGGDSNWVASPIHAHTTPEAYSAAGVVSHLIPGPGSAAFEDQVAQVIEGPSSFFAGRERIDEYGWRNYGEVFADHEQEHYHGTQPFVSHYNNQYDIIGGLLLQYDRTADRRWLDLALPLANHVADIDIYHTHADKPAYNGGLFWFTDHYLTTATCTHRTYSRQNRPAKGDYGGGPSSNHLFSTGLLTAYFLTGNPRYRDAVVELADWVIGMDDGARTVLGVIDAGPTGLASVTGTMDYHGPGRGCGNSVNALLDGWLLTGETTYLVTAEALIRRSIHPDDDIELHRLLDVEKRWSYTVFLVVLARYLERKAEAGQRDWMYGYGRAALLRYASWMLENEVPYFDKPEQLEYPTEAWAGQELRKANVLRLAAEHAEEPLRSRLLKRGEELADRAWKDLARFPSRTTSRAQALVLAEGPRDDFFRRQPAREMPPATEVDDFGLPVPFVPQKQRVVRRLRSPLGLAGAVLSLMNPRRWLRLWKARRT